MKKICSVLAAIILTSFLTAITAGCDSTVKNEAQLQSATEELQKVVQFRLSDLDNAVSDAAEKIAVSGLQSEATRNILKELYRKYPYIIDCSTADPEGKMITVEPEGYRLSEGTDTATTEASKMFFAGLSENRKPMLSNVFRAVEGFDAVVLVWPVVTEKGEMLGSVSALFQPETFFEEILVHIAETQAIKVNITQTDGYTIYCSNGNETGKNLLTDPRYKDFPGLVAMGEKMVEQDTGSAEYSFISDATGQPVRKVVFWKSIGLHDTEWRIASIAELRN